MKRKLLAGICVGMLTLSLVGCSPSDNKGEETPKKDSSTEQNVDAVGTASIPATTAEFESGIAADGRWIITPVADVTSDKDLVVEGEFYKKDDKANGVVLNNTKVEGNVYFDSEDIKSTFVLEGEASVSGVQEVK